jgi:Uma2 family endonuclease
MNTIMFDKTRVRIPSRALDLETFRRWAHSDEFPEKGHVAYLAGEVWVDMSKEQFSHNQVKGEVTSVLTALAKQARLGRVLPDGYLLTNAEADLSTNPDGIFASTASLQSGRVRLVAGAEEGYVELEGTPDMVLEIISPSSEEKDTEQMPALYWRAGIPEYWLIDVRADRLDFRILRRGPEGYVAVRPRGGWLKSRVFGKSFRLTSRVDPLGYPEYTLSVK